MFGMAVDSLVRCRVSADTKALLLSVAAREHLTESALVRQLIETMVRTTSPVSNTSLRPCEARGDRMSIRLAPDDRELLTERSLSRGMAAATYVAVLVRSHLRKLAPMPPPELAALKRCIAELAAMTGLLRQLTGPSSRSAALQAETVRNDLATMLRLSQALWETIKQMVKDNRESWERGYDDEPRT
jgi:hypothetical protein